MRAADAIKLYDMKGHEENGLYAERHYDAPGDARPASGSIYYYIGPEEVSAFHVIDCDEYWVHIAGEPIEIWVISDGGSLTRSRLGLGEGMEPLALIRAGQIFAARHERGAADGTFVACVTVPRFVYSGWRLVPKAEVISICPNAADFFRD